MDKFFRVAVNLGGILLVAAGIYTFPQDATDFVLLISRVILEKPVPSILVVIGFLVIGFGNQQQIRGYLGIRTAEDWRVTCRSWLESLHIGAINVPKQDLPEAAKWQLTCHDRLGRESGVYLLKDEPDILQIAFLVKYGNSESDQAFAIQQQFVDEVVAGLLQLDVVYSGLKVPLKTVQIQTSVPLGKELSKYGLNEKIMTIMRARELYAVLSDRVKRASSEGS